MSKIVRITLLAALMGLSLNAKAGIEAFMNDMFMYTSTNPQAVQAQGRGVFVGGHIAVRTPIRSINIINFARPDLQVGGCGGLDFFGGSFSMIDSDEAIALVRQIGANALMYAFKLGLESISSMIAGVLERLEKAIQEFNRHFRNTCEIGRMIAMAASPGGDSEPLKNWTREIGQSMCVVTGSGDDEADCRKQSVENPDQHVEEHEIEGKGNIAWVIMNEDMDIDFARLLNMSERQSMELVMSMTTTMFNCDVESDRDNDTPGPLITLNDLLQTAAPEYFSSSNGDSGGYQDVPRNLNVWRCDDVSSPDMTRQCCDPTIQELEIRGFREAVRDLMDELDMMMMTGDESIFENEAIQRFVNSTSIPVIYLLNRYAHVPFVRQMMMDYMVEIIAVEYLLRFAESVIRISDTMATTKGYPYPTNMNEARQRLLEDYRSLGPTSTDAMRRTLQLYEMSEAIDRSMIRSTTVPRWEQ
jgi:conjugative transfer pilus assembly protein TraH